MSAPAWLGLVVFVVGIRWALAAVRNAARLPAEGAPGDPPATVDPLPVMRAIAAAPGVTGCVTVTGVRLTSTPGLFVMTAVFNVWDESARLQDKAPESGAGS